MDLIRVLKRDGENGVIDQTEMGIGDFPAEDPPTVGILVSTRMLMR